MPQRELLNLISFQNILEKKLTYKRSDNDLNSEHYKNGFSKAQWNLGIRNIEKIEQISNKLKNKQPKTLELKNLEAQASLLKAYFTNSIDTLSDKSKENIKRIIFSNDEWQVEDLRLFAIAISLFDISELNSVVKSIISRHFNLNLEEKEFRLVLSAILVNFLSYSVKVQNSDIQLIKKVFQVLDNLNGEPDNCFAKLMTLYYREYFAENSKNMEEIIKVIRNSGMDKILKK